MIMSVVRIRDLANNCPVNDLINNSFVSWMPLPSPGLSKQIAGPQRNKQNTPNVLSAKIQPRSKVQIIYNNVGT